MIQCGLRKLPSPIVGDLRYLRRLSSSCDYSTKTLSQRYPDSRGCTLREGCDVMPLAVTLFVIFHCLINQGEIDRDKILRSFVTFKVYDRDLNSKFSSRCHRSFSIYLVFLFWDEKLGWRENCRSYPQFVCS